MRLASVGLGKVHRALRAAARRAENEDKRNDHQHYHDKVRQKRRPQRTRVGVGAFVVDIICVARICAVCGVDSAKRFFIKRNVGRRLDIRIIRFYVFLIGRRVLERDRHVDVVVVELDADDPCGNERRIFALEVIEMRFSVHGGDGLSVFVGRTRDADGVFKYAVGDIGFSLTRTRKGKNEDQRDDDSQNADQYACI